MVSGVPLPSEAEEATNPEAADRRYLEAVAFLRAHTVDRSRFPLVFAENVSYGFRRNALGLRPIALGVALVVLAITLVLIFVGQHDDLSSRAAQWSWGTAAAIAAGLFWWRVVTEPWVREAAELYAERLLEATPLLGALLSEPGAPR